MPLAKNYGRIGGEVDMNGAYFIVWILNFTIKNFEKDKKAIAKWKAVIVLLQDPTLSLFREILLKTF